MVNIAGQLITVCCTDAAIAPEAPSPLQEIQLTQNNLHPPFYLGGSRHPRLTPPQEFANLKPGSGNLFARNIRQTSLPTRIDGANLDFWLWREQYLIPFRIRRGFEISRVELTKVLLRTWKSGWLGFDSFPFSRGSILGPHYLLSSDVHSLIT